MATTTNYGWDTPDDTDLVKDGAAAIRTLGSSADTTVKNLNPGTTAGDIDYYTSGTAKARIGIGTAGQVLKVNSGATAPQWGVDPTTDVVTTAGDLIYATAADTVTRLGIGTAGQVLKVNSGATAPEWGAAGGAGGFIFVTSSTFSNVASVTIDNCFTSTYDTYLVTFVDCYGGTAADDAQIQWRFGGSTKSSLYWGSYFYYNSASFNPVEFSSASQATISDFVGSSTNKSNGQMFLSVAGASGQIMARGQWANADIEAANNFGNIVISTETYDGLVFKSSSSNVTGTIRVYGMVKS